VLIVVSTTSAVHGEIRRRTSFTKSGVVWMIASVSAAPTEFCWWNDSLTGGNRKKTPDHAANEVETGGGRDGRMDVVFVRSVADFDLIIQRRGLPRLTG